MVHRVPVNSSARSHVHCRYVCMGPRNLEPDHSAYQVISSSHIRLSETVYKVMIGWRRIKVPVSHGDEDQCQGKNSGETTLFGIPWHRKKTNGDHHLCSLR